jgi:serine phosphatase RsbU (regulator of sigma subunit)
MKSIIKINIFLALIFMFGNTFSQTNPQIDSIYAEILKAKTDTNKVDRLNDLAWQSVNSSFLTSAYDIALTSYNLAKRLNYTKGIAYSTKSVGATLFYTGDYDKALAFYEESFKSFTKLNDKKGISIALRNIGNVYHHLANYKVALDYYFKSLKIREELKDKAGIAAVYGAIGLVYNEQGIKERKSALEYFNKSLVIETELGNKSGMAQDYLYIGNIYFEKFKDNQKNIELADSALNFFNKCKKLSIEIENTYFLAQVEEAIGLNYSQRGEYDKSYQYFTRSLTLYEQIGSKYNVAGIYTSIGQYFMYIKNFNEARRYFENSYLLAKEINASEIEKESSSQISAVYSKLGNYKKAYDFQKIAIELKDSLQNAANTKKLTQIAMQFEFDKKEKLQQLEKQKREELFKSDIKRQKITTYFFVVALAFMILIAYIVFRSYRSKQRANILLEEKNAEINAQKEEIEQQRDYAIEQTEIIAEQHKHITDSIIYAQRIQQAVLPPVEYLDSLLFEYFVLYKPRDIVSGDYYWATKKEGKIIITAADCTGHGVPGAFMSLLGTSFLNEIVNKIDTSGGKEIIASEILDELRLAVKKSLRQTGKDSDAKDGMDMSLCIIDFPNMKMQYAGANNPILLVRENNLVKYAADRMPVGIHYKEEGHFSNQIIDLKRGDAVYMFSDGYVDQFGGEEGRKFMSKRFGELIMNNYKLNMKQQKEIFDKNIIEWQNHLNMKGEKFKQIDDILVIGFRV